MERCFAPSHLWLLHRPLSADALPQATSPNYLASGLAIRDAPAVAFLVASERTEGVSPGDTVPWRMVCRSLMSWTADRLLAGKTRFCWTLRQKKVERYPSQKPRFPVEVMHVELPLVVKCDIVFSFYSVLAIWASFRWGVIHAEKCGYCSPLYTCCCRFWIWLHHHIWTPTQFSFFLYF